MTLFSFKFIVFFLASFLLYYIVPKKFRWITLLVSSGVFYYFAGVPYTVVYLIVSIVISYFASNYSAKQKKFAENESEKGNDETSLKALKKSKAVFIIAVCINIGILAALKYTNFFLGNIDGIFKLFNSNAHIPEVNWLASLGCSFYTLQIVGYLADSYWGICEPERNIFKLALFTGYYPQMSSGPISRYSALAPQLSKGHDFNPKCVTEGMERMLLGMFKKLVIAQTLSPWTEELFASPEKYNGAYIWLAMTLYVIQIYNDFSGCMDIVLGASACYGIELPENFRTPFFSKTIQEFWQRWHITLGLWLKDFLMYPVLKSSAFVKMGRKIKSKFGRRAAKLIPLFVGMLLLWLAMGMWHGNGWKYIFEGIWFWLVIVLGKTLEPLFIKTKKFLHINSESKLWHAFQCVRTWIIYAIGALFFRASSSSEAFRMLKSAFTPHDVLITAKSTISFMIDKFTMIPVPSYLSAIMGLVLNVVYSSYIIPFILLMAIIDIYENKKKRSIIVWMNERNIVIRWIIIFSIFALIMIYGTYGSQYNPEDFIYGGF
jgi:alginate O-acetyltransferase complex protein AlgI